MEELDRAVVAAQTASHAKLHCVEEVATHCSQFSVSEKQGDTNNKPMTKARLPMIVQIVENFLLTPHVRYQAGCGYILFVKRMDRLPRMFQIKRPVNGLGRGKRTGRSRPNSGHHDETNTTISAAAAFRRPLPLSERPQLGGKRTFASSLSAVSFAPHVLTTDRKESTFHCGCDTPLLYWGLEHF